MIRRVGNDKRKWRMRRQKRKVIRKRKEEDMRK